jgi:nucleoid-associated protein YgaU
MAAGVLVGVQAGCGTTSDEELTEQEAGLDADGENAANDNAEGFENAEGSENAENSENAGNEYVNESTDGDSFNNFENFENSGTVAEDGSVNNLGSESNETADLINESAGDAFDSPVGETVASSPGEDPFAANATNTDPFAANDAAAGALSDNSGGDPFAATNSSGADPFASPVVAADNSASSAGDAGFVSEGGQLNLPAQGYLPEDGVRMAYLIQVGDTLASISQKIYGTSSSWRTIASENNLSNPNLIYVGDVIYYSLSGTTRKFAESYETAPRKTVTVQAGDSLSIIAARVYGSEGAWRTLWKENPSVSNPDELKVGMVLSYRGGSAFSDASPNVSPNGQELDEGIMTTSLGF